MFSVVFERLQLYFLKFLSPKRKPEGGVEIASRMWTYILLSLTRSESAICLVISQIFISSEKQAFIFQLKSQGFWGFILYFCWRYLLAFFFLSERRCYYCYSWFLPACPNFTVRRARRKIIFPIRFIEEVEKQGKQFFYQWELKFSLK